MILADPLHEPKVRQGITTEVIGVDGNSYAPFATPQDLAAFVELNAGLDGDPRHRPDDWDTRRELPRRGSTARSASTSPPDRATRRCGSRRVGWDDEPATPAQRRAHAGAAPRGHGGGRVRAQLGPRLPARQLRHDRRAGGRSPARRRGTAASTTPTSATRSVTASSTRSGRRSRSAGAARRRPTSPTSTTARRSRARPTRCSSSSTTRARDGPRRHLRRLPGRVGEHASPDPDPDLGPGRRPGARRRSASPTARTRDRIRRELQERGALFAGAGGLARRPDRLPPPAREPPLGGPDARRADRRRPAATRSTRCATCCSPRTSARTRSRPARTPTASAASSATRSAMVGTDSTFVGAKPSPRTYGSFPRILGQFVRDEALLEPRGGDPRG